MNKDSQASKPMFHFLPTDIEGFDTLTELALDMSWSWNHATDDVWRQLDPVLWELTHHPWDVLQTVSREKLQVLLADVTFRKQIDTLLDSKNQTKESSRWFQKKYPKSALTCVAYFSMEFMLSEALPIYSGGLGNVAGDQLKAASDLGVPVVGVGLLYQKGYFRQIIDKDGKQQALYPYNDPGQLPITPLRQPNGEWLRLEVILPGYSVWLRAWQVQVGKVKLLLLDSNDPANLPIHRGITSELYGSGPELRLKQEMILGIGGWRLLRALGLNPEVCHLNEGHAALAVLERAHSFMVETAQPFEVALAVTRAGNIFTTHTAVAAGFDHFEPALIEQYLLVYAQKLGLTFHDLMALGRQNPDDSSERFTMANLAIRGSGAVNGVSRLHGQVSKRLFGPLFSGWPNEEMPIGHITNGVHMPTWDSAEADTLWTNACGKDRWLGELESLETDIRKVSDEALWSFRIAASNSFVKFVRDWFSRQMAANGASPDAVTRSKHIFDPNALTLGFARRFTTYKRPNMLLQDPERLLRLLTNPQRPVQLIIAGKAHPEDSAGQAMIEQWVQFIQRHDVYGHVIFLSDYNMLLSQYLAQGVDVWINTPRYPWEACGTSGMKVLVNGGLNLSELDGWWAEAYTPEVGWALGDAQKHGDDPGWDDIEAETLYERLEREVIPEFYDRDKHGIPRTWVTRMRESMAKLTPTYSSNRAVREYTEQHYLPAADAYWFRSAEKGAVGNEIIAWQRTLEQQWHTLKFGEIQIETQDDSYIIDVEVFFGNVDPDAVRVELYAEGLDGGAPWLMYLDEVDPKALQVELYAKGSESTARVRMRMRQLHAIEGMPNAYVYRGAASAVRPSSDYTARVIAQFPGVAVPLEASFITWQK